MVRTSHKTIFLAFSFAVGLAISFQNCTKSQFTTVNGEESLSSTSTGVRCTVDQVIDLSGKCVNNSDIPRACTINGQLLGNGNSVQVYQASSVPAGSQCVSATQTCSNGSLTGSSYTALSCQVQAPPTRPGSGATPLPTTPSTPLSCKFNGMNIAIGQTVTAYAASSAATCLSQQRVCNEKGELTGSYQFPSCQKLPAGATCSFNGQPLKAGDLVLAYKVPSSASATDCQPESRICQSNGTLTGSYAYDSCLVTNTAPSCNPLEVLATLRTYTQMILTDKYSIAKACIDDLTPTIEGSYPESVPGSPGHYLRFMNTCGNRFCKQQQNGFLSGRVVENNEAGYLVECRTNQVPPEITDACKQRLQPLPKPIDILPMQDTVVAQLCGLSAPPTNEMELIQWVYTCGHRACKSKGYSAGRAVEYHGGMTTLECAREETLNNLEAGALVQAINTTVNEVSKACVDRVNPAVTDSYPSNGYGQAVRFYNTCGRRYCMNKGFEGGGRVTMWSGGASGSSAVELICMK